MRSRLAMWLWLCACVTVFPALRPPAGGQVQNGEIFGKVTDTSGAVLPGVTVTIDSPSLLQTQSVTTTETGVYRFASLPLGLYTVTFQMSGFTRFVRRDVRIETGFSAEVSPQLSVSNVQEEVVVSGETPVIDTRSTTLSATFNQEMLDKLPSARDPWVILEQMPGMVMDRQNVGGSESGQQSTFIAHGSSINQQWNVNGATVTDMVSGGSPMYFDFDSIAEIQIQTGGGDASLQSGGAAINLVTKSGRTCSRAAAASSTSTTPCSPTTRRPNCANRAPAPAIPSRTSRNTASKRAAPCCAIACSSGAPTAGATSAMA